MIVGRRRVHIPWWRVLWMKFNGSWWPFLAYVMWVDLDYSCHICGARGDERCDAGLHS